ncbi:MAG: hypothetical protein NVSMB25_22180 [Thermoleophilaceae bacterium]
MSATITNLSERPRRPRPRRRLRVAGGRRSTETRRGGRMWVNGRELGGGAPRLSYLSEAYD